MPPNPDSGQQSFLHMNWSQEQENNVYHKNTNGISDKLAISQSTGRRTPYNSIELQNGSIYHSFNNNSQFNNTNDTQNNSNNNTNNNNNSSNNSNTTQFIPTTTYSTNQSQSFTSPQNQDFSSHESNASSPASQSRSQSQRSNSRPNSRSSPARAVSSGNIVNKNIETESMATHSANGVNQSQNQLANDQTLENEPFLSNTTTTMHHNNQHLSDMTTSMNTSTGNQSFNRLFIGFIDIIK